MLFLTRTMLPAFALAAMMSVAQGRAAVADDAHHPDGATATTQAQPVPTPPPAPSQPPQGAQSGASGNAPMIGQGMGSGAIVQPGAQPQTGQPGMMMGMDQMRSMMGGMMGQQDGQSGMMGTMMRPMMLGQQDGMGLPFEHVEGRIAFLKTEIKITDAQTPQWNAFADVLRANAKAHQAVHEQMSKSGMPGSWPERLVFQQKALSTRLDALKALEAAAKPLYAVLTDEQKKRADQLLSSPMGMM